MEPSEITLVQPESEASPGPETSTTAIPIQDLDEFRTSDIDPSLLPGPKTVASAPIALRTPSSGKALKLWLGLAAVALVAVGLAAYGFLRSRPAEPGSDASAAQEPAQARSASVPPELRSYMDQAKGGDAKAMHMIALMYWNGLNVRQDRAKGLEWYKMASAAGDKAAQKELAVIEGKP